ncbi:MAG: hypothetical protein IPO92_17530 [Saprospiraceae bacterium]|nr:hypothetical protein [Saprospiraceae bacterium]
METYQISKWKSIERESKVGLNGYLVNVRDAQSIVQAIRNFLTLNYEQKKAMGEAGREKVCREFDDKLIAQQIFDIVKKEL